MSPHRTDHDASADDAVLLGLADADALALAEACSRTLGAAHAVARRLVPATDVERVLRDVYARMWSDPPGEGPLEGWVRRQCFASAVALLRSRGDAPVAPSARLAAPDLPAPAAAFLDAVERAIAALAEEERRAIVRAHDAGMPARGPRAPREGAAATRALLALAEAGPDVTVSEPRAADWVLGLLPAAEAAAVAAALGGAGGEPARALRRGRRRLEGLPAGADLAARLVAATLAGVPPPPAPGELDPFAEAEARIEVGAALPADAPADDAPADATAPDAGGAPAGTDLTYAELLDDGDRAGDEDRDGPDTWDGDGPDTWDTERGEPEEPEPRGGRGVLMALGWLIATAAAVGVGMLVGRLVLEGGLPW